MALPDENCAIYVICGEHKEYVNFAHRILQSIEIKVK